MSDDVDDDDDDNDGGSDFDDDGVDFNDGHWDYCDVDRHSNGACDGDKYDDDDDYVDDNDDSYDDDDTDDYVGDVRHVVDRSLLYLLVNIMINYQLLLQAFIYMCI
jgi:hypothetical protein